MSDKFILNTDHSLRQVDDLEEWARAFESTDRHVARTDVAPGVWVSTVFLGLDHSFGNGPPLVFETMIFRKGGGEEQWRYSTWDEAVAGHEEAVRVASGILTEGGDVEQAPGDSLSSAVPERQTPTPQGSGADNGRS